MEYLVHELNLTIQLDLKKKLGQLKKVREGVKKLFTEFVCKCKCSVQSNRYDIKRILADVLITRNGITEGLGKRH